MASKKSKPSAANDEIDELFDILGEDGGPKKTTKAKPAAASAKPKSGAGGGADQDILAELENQLGEKQPSRPHTPRISKEIAAKGSPARRAAGAGTPPPQGERTSEDRPGLGARKSVESTRSFHASFTPSATSSELQESEKKPAAEPAPAAGGGWWGSIMSTATAAMKQAEITVKDLQQNEEAKKWTEQLRGNVTALRGYGDEIRHRALPTFTDILHTLAPPISSHERLLIHITHDMAGYPSLDPLIYGVFSRVMSQVEGGDLMVIQRGHENTLRSPSSETRSAFATSSSAAGWRDGPWWRASDLPRDLGAVKGLMEGTKLCRTSAEAYSTEYFASHGGVDAARQRALEPVSESNPVRSSDLFLSVQAILSDADEGLFAASKSGKADEESSPVGEAESAKDEMICFAVCILDPVHDIMFHTVSQEMPVKWTQWLDAPAPLTPGSSGDESTEYGGERVPDEIREIVENGGVDPREWVAEWVEEVIGLSVGVVAQRYVARRMGVGEGGIGKGKQRAEVVLQDGGGEAARAGVI